MPEQEWTEGFSRQVLVDVIYGELVKALPGAFSADLFEPSSPRGRIALQVEGFIKEYGRGPGEGETDLLVAQAMDGRPEAEQEQIAEEWAYIREQEPSDDSKFTAAQVRARIEYRRWAQAIEQASERLDSDGPEAARESLLRVEPVRAENEGRILRFREGAEERMQLWSKGDIYGERIPTGMPELDRAMGGGPARKENWFFLAPPKGLKTAFLLNVARGGMRRGKNVYVNTYEMQDMRMMLRLDQMEAKTNKAGLLGTDDTMPDFTNLRRALQGLSVSNQGDIFVTRRRTQQKEAVRQVEADVRRLRDQGITIDVVIMDYLNIMGSGKNEKELRTELFYIAYEMADMAKTLDVVVWSAALVNRQAVDKAPIRKNDIAESFGVIGAVDGAVAICSPPILVQNNIRRLYMAAAREERDEVMAGDYITDWSTMSIRGTSQERGDELLASVRPKARVKPPSGEE